MVNLYITVASFTVMSIIIKIVFDFVCLFEYSILLAPYLQITTCFISSSIAYLRILLLAVASTKTSG